MKYLENSFRFNFDKFFFIKKIVHVDFKANCYNLFFIKKKNKKFFLKKLFSKSSLKDFDNFIYNENNFFLFNFFNKFNNFFFRDGLKTKTNRLLSKNMRFIIYNLFNFNKKFKGNNFKSYKNFFFFFKQYNYFFTKNYLIYFFFDKFKLNFELKYIKIKKKKFKRNFILLKYLYTKLHKFNVFCKFLKKNLKIFKKFKFKKNFFIIFNNGFFSLDDSILYKSKNYLNNVIFSVLRKSKVKNLIF